ncbi:MAG TPA: hypothetical protein VFY15_02150, partial [Acidimicrobiia bacterium]|nr:hypothetical protein [Acidimicrobiia bacterium]
LRTHLAELLQRDGFDRSAIFEVAAAPPRGPRLGIDALYTHLTSRLDEKRVHLGRVVEEARSAARRVAAAAGLAGGGSLGFEERWETVRNGVVQLLTAEGPRIGRLEEALRRVEHMVGSIAAEAGGAFGLRTRQVFGPERVEEEVRAAVAAMDLVSPGVAASSEMVRQARAAVLDTELQLRIGAPLRRILWERASLAAVVAGLAVDSARAESHLGIGLGVD